MIVGHTLHVLKAYSFISNHGGSLLDIVTLILSLFPSAYSGSSLPIQLHSKYYCSDIAWGWSLDLLPPFLLLQLFFWSERFLLAFLACSMAWIYNFIGISFKIIKFLYWPFFLHHQIIVFFYNLIILELLYGVVVCTTTIYRSIFNCTYINNRG